MHTNRTIKEICEDLIAYFQRNPLHGAEAAPATDPVAGEIRRAMISAGIHLPENEKARRALTTAMWFVLKRPPVWNAYEALAYEGKPLPSDRWEEADEDRCSTESWGLFDGLDGKSTLQAVASENLKPGEEGFENNTELLYYVRTKASAGSPFHQKALRFHGTTNPIHHAWADARTVLEVISYKTSAIEPTLKSCSGLRSVTAAQLLNFAQKHATVSNRDAAFIRGHAERYLIETPT